MRSPASVLFGGRDSRWTNRPRDRYHTPRDVVTTEPPQPPAAADEDDPAGSSDRLRPFNHHHHHHMHQRIGTTFMGVQSPLRTRQPSPSSRGNRRRRPTRPRTVVGGGSARRPVRGSWREFLFGFMYEDDDDDDDDENDINDYNDYNDFYTDRNEANRSLHMDEDHRHCDDNSNHEDTLDRETTIQDNNASYVSTAAMEQPNSPLLNPLHFALCLSLMLQSIALAAVVTIPTAIAADLLHPNNDNSSTTDDDNNNNPDALLLRSLTAAAVIGTATGKLLHGPVPDVWGARRTSVGYTFATSVALLVLAVAPTTTVVVQATAVVHCLYAVQWPCVVVTLATHHGPDPTTAAYEQGIFAASLACRVGSLVGIPGSVLLLRMGQAQQSSGDGSGSSHLHWRVVAGVAAWLAAVASSITYFFVWDSRDSRDDPQNPIDPILLKTWFPDQYRGRKRWTLCKVLRLGLFCWTTNIMPSVRHIASSGTFWIVAAAHTGASMIRTSEPVLGTYLAATSDGTVPTDAAASLAVWHSVGTVAGLLLAGRVFARTPDPRDRKWMITRLYGLTIVACYVLALAAAPSVRHSGLFQPTPEIITRIQVGAIAAAGFGVSIQFYHIPSMVGATFGCDQGLFTSYTDGVAYGLASLVWRFVSDTISASGWAYGWAAVALLLILSAVVMAEFMEHFFCRPRRNGTYETLLLA